MKQQTRWIALILTLLLCLQLLPLGVFAAENTAKFTTDQREPLQENVDTSETLAEKETTVTVSSNMEYEEMPFGAGVAMENNLMASTAVQPMGDSQTGIKVTKASILPLTKQFQSHYYTYPNDPQKKEHYFWCGEIAGHWIDGSNAYCIEPHRDSADGMAYKENQNVGAWAYLSQNQKNAIALVICYGYRPGHTLPELGTDSSANNQKMAATQIIVWEIVSGYRSPVYPYGQVSNDSFLIDSCVNHNSYPVVRKAYNAILAGIQNHDVIPSFATKSETNAPLITLKYNASSKIYTATLTDSNVHKLTDGSAQPAMNAFVFTLPNGISMTKDGATVTISSNQPISSDLTISAESFLYNISSANILPWSPTDEQIQKNQTLATVAGVDPIHIYLHLRTEATGKTELLKATDSGSPAGAKMKLYYRNSNTAFYGVSDEDGRVFFTDSEFKVNGAKIYQQEHLSDGNYRFKEYPTTNTRPDKIEIYVRSADGTVTPVKTFAESEIQYDSTDGGYAVDYFSVSGLNNGGTLVISVHNCHLTGSVHIRKVDYVNTDLTLKDSSFTIYAKNGTVVGELTNNGDGTYSYSNLAYGSYLLEETRAPTGYDRDTTQYPFTLDDTNKEVWLTSNRSTQPKLFGNAPSPIRIMLEKVTESEKPLQHAQFRLEQSVDGQEWTVIADAVSGKDGCVDFGLQPVCGYLEKQWIDYSYRISETEAPVGYLMLEDPVVFTGTLREFVPVGIVNITITNAVAPGTITVKKVDDQGKALAGVEFLLEYSVDDGKTYRPVTLSEDLKIGGCFSEGLQDGRLTTGADGIICFERLYTFGVTYRLTETATAPGYQLLSELVFTGSIQPEETLDLEFTVINYPDLQMPHTGTNTLHILSLLGTTAMLSSVAAFFAAKKKKHN